MFVILALKVKQYGRYFCDCLWPIGFCWCLRELVHAITVSFSYKNHEMFTTVSTQDYILKAYRFYCSRYESKISLLF